MQKFKTIHLKIKLIIICFYSFTNIKAQYQVGMLYRTNLSNKTYGSNKMLPSKGYQLFFGHSFNINKKIKMLNQIEYGSTHFKDYMLPFKHEEAKYNKVSSTYGYSSYSLNSGFTKQWNYIVSTSVLLGLNYYSENLERILTHIEFDNDGPSQLIWFNKREKEFYTYIIPTIEFNTNIKIIKNWSLVLKYELAYNKNRYQVDKTFIVSFPDENYTEEIKGRTKINFSMFGIGISKTIIKNKYKRKIRNKKIKSVDAS